MMRRSETIARVLGLLWGIVPLSYWLTQSSTPAYMLILFTYGFFLLIGGVRAVPNVAFAVVAVVGLFVALSFSVEVDKSIVVRPYIGLMLFAINLSMLLITIAPNQTYTFFRVFFKVTAACAILHVILVFGGQIGNHYGRFLFLGDQHPNLGGEIYAVAALAGALSSGRKEMVLFSGPMLVSGFLMQTRTGLAVCVLTLLFKVFLAGRESVNFRSLVAGAGGATLLVAALAIIPQLRGWFLAKVLLANDPYRGISTGLVSGRDSQWVSAFRDFSQSPFFGNGLSWYNHEGTVAAHNPILFSLVYFGIFGLMFWVMIGWYSIFLANRNFQAFILMIPSFLMIFLNDRFLNSNPFPLLFYFYIFQLSRRQLALAQPTSRQWNTPPQAQ